MVGYPLPPRSEHPPTPKPGNLFGFLKVEVSSSTLLPLKCQLAQYNLATQLARYLLRGGGSRGRSSNPFTLNFPAPPIDEETEA